MRPMSKRRYLFAFIITTAIFFLGFFVGFWMDLQRIDYFQVITDAQKLNIRSLELQNDLIKNSPVNTCAAFRFMFDKAIVELENNRVRIDTYNKQSKVKKDEFDAIKREYLLSQINFWLISKNLKASCPNESDFVTVVYFLSDDKNCPLCGNQAAVLNYYKSILNENILIFSVDETFEDKEPLITLLKQAYDAKSYPTLIIDNQTYHEYVDKDKMGNILCGLYQSEATRNITCG